MIKADSQRAMAEQIQLLDLQEKSFLSNQY